MTGRHISLKTSPVFIRTHFLSLSLSFNFFTAINFIDAENYSFNSCTTLTLFISFSSVDIQKKAFAQKVREKQSRKWREKKNAFLLNKYIYHLRRFFFSYVYIHLLFLFRWFIFLPVEKYLRVYVSWQQIDNKAL